LRVYKTELDPNNSQKTYFLKCAGISRFAYNWGLDRKQEEYKAGRKTPTAFDLINEMVLLKKTDRYKWIREVSKWIPSDALRNLDFAFTGFFIRVKKGQKPGFPKYKSKHKSKNSFTFYEPVTVKYCSIQIPRLGYVRLKEKGYIPTDKLVKHITVSERAGKWFVSVLTDEPEPRLLHGSEIIGVDLGVKNLAVLSNGVVFENPKALKKAEKRLAYLQRSLSRKKKGSKNREKAKSKVAKQYYKVYCKRKDASHKLSSAIIKLAKVIVIENLNVSGMLKNRKLSKSIADASLGEIRRQIEYKARWAGIEVIKADRFYPSSKICSCCGNIKKDLTLADRIYKCDVCNLVIDRDLNAAINLRNLAGGLSVTACGELVQQGQSMKQELSSRVSAI
jgi:putative transposase